MTLCTQAPLSPYRHFFLLFFKEKKKEEDEDEEEVIIYGALAELTRSETAERMDMDWTWIFPYVTPGEMRVYTDF